MTDIASAQPVPQTEAEHKAAFERLMLEAEGINEHMRRDRIEIERLKAGTIWDEMHTLFTGTDSAQVPWEQRRDNDIAARNQENMALQAENDRLRSTRGLPPYGGSRLF